MVLHVLVTGWTCNTTNVQKEEEKEEEKEKNSSRTQTTNKKAYIVLRATGYLPLFPSFCSFFSYIFLSFPNLSVKDPT
jgi:hypothetical protein